MTKIMLVEDDKSLREIYGVRLLAEGYDIVSAGDGEEALAMAIKERPTLIVSDVMMPKISGFDMLDILRSTTETKDIKVIMMTALSSEEQRNRGQSLGADRYLVKSQVGIEDVVHVVHEVLGDNVDPAGPQAPSFTPQPPTTYQPQQPTTQPPQQQVAPQPAPQAQPPAAPQPAPPRSGFTFQSNQPSQIPNSIPRPTPVQQAHTSSAPKPLGSSNRVIQPLNDPASQQIDINELLDKELAKEAGVAEGERPAVATTEQERAVIDSQLQQFTAAPPPQPTTPTLPTDMPPEQPEGTSQHVEISPDGQLQPEAFNPAPPQSETQPNEQPAYQPQPTDQPAVTPRFTPPQAPQNAQLPPTPPTA